jgi:hypothetical protein
MAKEKIILRKDVPGQRIAEDRAQDDLVYMQRTVDYYNSLHYTEDLTTLDGIKTYLSNPFEYHEAQVLKFLKSKHQGELPPNLETLRQSWDIAEVADESYSDSKYFDYLELDQSGRLCYSDEVWQMIDAENTIFATPEQERILKSLDKFLAQYEVLAKIWHSQHPNGRSFEFAPERSEIGFLWVKGDHFNDYKPQWNLEILDLLTNEKF